LLAALEADAPGAPGMKPRLQYASLSPNAGGVRSDAPSGRAARPDRSVSATMLGGLDRPATGRLVRGWGEKMPGGSTSEGLAIATRAQAQVSAPVDGRIEFAGPFRTYGQLLIISTSDGYHVLLSGMAESYVGVGQSVKRGEPVARMTNRVNPEPELYMEVRQDGKPMDPARWMKGS
ncbi:MAG: peptidoglycan DD-metalloendopeptidase family protein, partial [Alphaproteobacteria bacterium]|nr:peptidoglycan DD-metalloendopeptidase family protein [Alphaproteobacteria bacterium]